MFDFDLDGSDLNLNNPKYLTHFNADGYNNQPSFFNDDMLYISSDYKAEVNTEIYSLDISNKRLLRVTNTTQSEYSPTLMPDRRSFSVIRQGNIANKDQLLWRYPLDRSNEGAPLIEDLTNVGYHTWLSRDKVLMFLVDEPHKLVEYTLSTGLQEIITEDIGRAIVRKGDYVYYVEKVSRKFWYLKAYNFVENTVETITQTLREKEDFALTEDGTFLMSSGKYIFAFKPDEDNVWRKVADMEVFGLNKVTRMAVSNNKIALVNVTE